METMPPPSEDISHAHGLAREMIDRIADKWTLLVISALGKTDKLRFTQLRRQIEDISQKMLTQTLRQLQRDGMVSRRVYPVVPPRVEYQLTPLGRSLLTSVNAICDWVSHHLKDIEDARHLFDKRMDEMLD